VSEAAAGTPAAKGKTAAVHDLGYKPYEGPRRPQHTRHRVIVWNQVAMAWRGWWRMKMWLIGAAMMAIGFGAAIYLMFFVTKNPIVQGMLGGSGAPLRMTEFLLPQSVDFTTMIAFVLGLTVVAGVVADDMRAGAFEFYFSRPVRPVDYVYGKVVGSGLIIAAVALGAPLIVALSRVGMAGGGGEVADSLHYIPRMAAAGVTATALYTLVPLAISAIGSRRRYTIAGWAMFYLVIGNTAMLIGHESGISAIGAISIKGTVMSITYALFDVKILFGSEEETFLPPVEAAVAAAVTYTAISIGFLYWRVRRAERAGMGGG
jgi:ABC-type transport system involved in multi-copper enzyme maturation permease subunit